MIEVGALDEHINLVSRCYIQGGTDQVDRKVYQRAVLEFHNILLRTTGPAGGYS